MNYTASTLECPICGKKPKIKIKRYPNGGTDVTIKCQKRFGNNKHRVRIIAGAASETWACEKAIDKWKEACEEIEEESLDFESEVSE